MRVAITLFLAVGWFTHSIASLPLWSFEKFQEIDKRGASYSVVAVDGGSSSSDTVEVETTTEVMTVTQTATATATPTETTIFETVTASAPSETPVTETVTATEIISASPAPTQTVVSTMLISGSDTTETVVVTITQVATQPTTSPDPSTTSDSFYSLISMIIVDHSTLYDVAASTSSTGSPSSSLPAPSTASPALSSAASVSPSLTTGTSSSFTSLRSPFPISSPNGVQWDTNFLERNSSFAYATGSIRSSLAVSIPSISSGAMVYPSVTQTTSADPLPTLSISPSATDDSLQVPALAVPQHDNGSSSNPVPER